jgi:hypothetical protein
VPDGFAISRIDLETEGTVPGIDAATFESSYKRQLAGLYLARITALSGA